MNSYKQETSRVSHTTMQTTKVSPLFSAGANNFGELTASVIGWSWHLHTTQGSGASSNQTWKTSILFISHFLAGFESDRFFNASSLQATGIDGPQRLILTVFAGLTSFVYLSLRTERPGSSKRMLSPGAAATSAGATTESKATRIEDLMMNG